jgi:hypothetical protein
MRAGALLVHSETVWLAFEAEHDLILDHTAEVPCKCGAGYAEQFCRTPLILIRLLEHEMYMPFHGALERKIDVGVVRFIIGGQCRNWFAHFGSGVGFQIRRKNDVLRQDHRRTAEQCHGSHRVT